MSDLIQQSKTHTRTLVARAVLRNGSKFFSLRTRTDRDSRT